MICKTLGKDRGSSLEVAESSDSRRAARSLAWSQ